jgi:hypothetical protein
LSLFVSLVLLWLLLVVSTVLMLMFLNGNCWVVRVIMNEYMIVDVHACGDTCWHA